ncbi:MAG: aminopeptidase [Candidatus Verstraetearchaeota archaeon]|nr:aminopeptidase [Candidatus Verstraetearchaeota archaeon]
MSELTRQEMAEYASALVNRSMSIGRKPGDGFESVSIVYNDRDLSCEEFAELVEEECWRQGAYTIIRGYSSVRSRRKYELSPEESLRGMDPIAKAIAETVDVRMFIGEEDDPCWQDGVSEKVKLTAPNRQRLYEIMDRRGVRWVYFGWPIPGAARGYGCPVERFREIFFNSIRASFSEELLDLCSYYSGALRGVDRVRILAEDTDLSFSVKGRPVIVDDGIVSKEDVANGDVGLNIPSGEVFIAPLETSANGHITFPLVVIPGFGRIEQLRLEFKEGKVDSYSAAMGAERFAKFLDANTGEKDRIAELGIGCNPGAEFTGGSIIIDEKIYRTVHIAIGNNTGSYHGINQASSHLDMIKDMRCGKLFFDGRLVMDGGEPVR